MWESGFWPLCTFQVVFLYHLSGLKKLIQHYSGNVVAEGFSLDHSKSLYIDKDTDILLLVRQMTSMSYGKAFGSSSLTQGKVFA